MLRCLPPSPCRTTTPSTFTEWQMAFIGPHHIFKILRRKAETNHKGYSNEPPTIVILLQIIFVVSQKRSNLSINCVTGECTYFISRIDDTQYSFQNYILKILRYFCFTFVGVQSDVIYTRYVLFYNNNILRLFDLSHVREKIHYYELQKVLCKNIQQ